MTAHMTSHGWHPFSHPGVDRKTASFVTTPTPTATWERQGRLAVLNNLRLLLVLPCALLASACEPNNDVELANANAKIKQLEADLALEKALDEKRQADAAVADYERSSRARSNEAAVAPPSEPEGLASPAVDMCYKDYCPCEPPQGGPDTVLCDQLEQGIDVDAELLIAGRGMREARRQMATGDY